MTHTPDITRPAKDLIEALKDIGSATVAGTLGHMGIRNPHIMGPVSWNKGKSIVGPALTLQFMPKREDLYGEGEYADPEKQLHRHVLYHVAGRRHRRRRRARRHERRRLRRHDVDLLQGSRRRRHGDRRLHARLSEPEEAGPAACGCAAGRRTSTPRPA